MVPPHNAGWSVRDVKDFVEARSSGAGLWQLQGSLIALSTGRRLASITGVEEVRLCESVRRHKNRNPRKSSASSATRVALPLEDGGDADATPKDDRVTHTARMLVRDSLFFTTERGGLMREFRLRPTIAPRRVSHVLPGPSGVRVERRADGSVRLSRRDGRWPSGAGATDAAGVAADDEAAADGENGSAGAQGGRPVVHTLLQEAPRRVDVGMRSMLSGAWGFVGRRVKSGAVSLPGVVEHCDFVLGRHHGVWNWSRVGRCPSWYGRGQCVMYLSARKVSGWSGLDEGVRAFMGETGRARLRASDMEGEGEAETEAEMEGAGGSDKAEGGGSSGGTVVARGGGDSGAGECGEKKAPRRRLFGFIVRGGSKSSSNSNGAGAL